MSGPDDTASKSGNVELIITLSNVDILAADEDRIAQHLAMSVMGRYAVLGAQLIRRGPRPTSSAGWREERLALLTVRADDEVVDCVDLAVSMMCAAEYVVERAGAAQDRRALLDPDQPAPVLPSAALLAQARDAADAECITQLTHDRVDTLVSASNAPSQRPRLGGPRNPSHDLAARRLPPDV